ncbi:tripartite tricarboxylate transporter substrate binding protein [Pusillimonas sp. TS35]|uniref:Bug family tripartite tricarboxylate transporter substrate binding protein n=1 Tax=Paracandidimonas lactea TaxID=2895524 RepID=UPI00136E144B|nr:tripartite tricarboxylate transporter substrate binding protein [Paracandidimonas lactea]MYN11731.1 tripartite tricarboxylate transporter substrate binding protein [Pusillimonas sp. TS35]
MAITFVRRLFITGMMLGSAAAVSAAQWPDHTVRVIVPYSTGGVSDAIGRAISEHLGEKLGAPFVVENKGGAGGTLGMAELAKAKPDGYTLAFSAVSPLTLSPLFNPVQYDPAKDIIPVARVMVSPVLLLGTKSFSGKTVGDVVEMSKKDPGGLRWATSGQGSLGHLMMEQFQAATKTTMTHVPYKGSGQQLTDALGGQFELASMNVSPTLTSHVTAGTLRPLILAAPQRLDSLPGVPTFTELGYPKANIMSVFGFFAPAGLPAETLARINAEVNAAVQSPKVQKLLKDSGNVPATGTPNDFAAQMQDELKANTELVQAVGLSKK